VTPPTLTGWVLGRDDDPPLDPSGADARRALRRELLHPEYHRQNAVQQVLNWINRRIERGLNAAHEAPSVSTVMAMIVFVVLALALAWLASRARRTAAGPDDDRPVLSEEKVTAAELRRRAEAALAADDYVATVVEGFRALTLRQVERGRLPDTTGTTAHEVSTALATEYPSLARRVAASADVFDAVLYGDRPATRGQAVDVLALEDDLAGARR
jgi:hypothetical protein